MSTALPAAPSASRSRLAALAHRVGARALDLLLPPHCMGCTAATQLPYGLCAACFGSLTFITAPLCRVCGVPFAYAGQGGSLSLCEGCTARTWRFATARGALRYDDASRALLLRFKHAGRTELASLFAPMMARAGRTLLDEADLLVPVPLHRARLRHRGFNQAAWLAARLARAASRPMLVDALIRSRPTAPMGTLGAAQRAENLGQAISVAPRHAPLLAGLHVLVIDDVMTSGATLDACAASLLGAGAARVSGLVAARVPDPRISNTRRAAWT